MLFEAINASMLAQHFQYIDHAEVKDAFVYLVGLAATDPRYQCYGEIKGVMRDFRFYEESGQQPFAFIVNRESLLFYFRKPAVRSGLFEFTALQRRFATASENTSGEWTVRISNVTDVKLVWSYITLQSDFHSGDSPTTQVGFVNRHNQRCAGHRGIAGNDHLQRAYRMECLQPKCGHIYGANGSDVFQRKCPKCQGGQPGLAFR